MTFPQSLVIVSALLLLWGGYAYLRDTLAGRTKPNRVTWFLWALAPWSASVLLFQQTQITGLQSGSWLAVLFPPLYFWALLLTKTAIGDSPGLIGFAVAYL